MTQSEKTPHLREKIRDVCNRYLAAVSAATSSVPVMRRRSQRGSLACEGDEHVYMREMRSILESQPVVGPPQTIDQLNGHVFIGSQRNASDVAMLRRLGITHVLHCAAPSPNMRSPYSTESGVVAFLALSAEDHTEYDVTQHFGAAFAFLDKAKRRGGRALVHCNLGINRSGAVCAAYLMVDQRTKLLDVVRMLKAKRSVVLWNRGFRLQLVRFARSRRLLGSLPAQLAASRRSSSSDSLKVVTPERRTSRSTSPAARHGERRNSREEDSGINASMRRSFRSRLATSLLSRRTPGEDAVEESSSSSKSIKAFLTIPRSFGSSLKESKHQRRYASSSRHLSDSYVRPEEGASNGVLPGILRHAHSSGDCASSPSSRKASVTSRVTIAGNAPEEDTSLSTTRPLRVYKKAATDTLLYVRTSHPAGSVQLAREMPNGDAQKSNRTTDTEPRSSQRAYARAAPTTTAAGETRRSMRDTRTVSNGTTSSDETRRSRRGAAPNATTESGDERHGSVSMLSRTRPRTSRTSLNT